MAKSESKPTRKLETVSDVNTEYLYTGIREALNSDPSVKAVFRPGEIGMKSGQGTLVIIMNDGQQYRLETRFVRVKSE